MTESTSSSDAHVDVVIVGAGPAGLSLACALGDLGLRTDVLEQLPLSALEAPADDGREIALTWRSRRLMTQLGLWQALPANAIAPLREARVIDGTHERTLRFAPDSGSRGPLGWLVPNHCIRAAAILAARRRPSVRLRCEARVDGLALDQQRAGVTLATGERIDAALVVAADSRFSPTRRLAGIGAAMRDFGRSVIVACVAHTRSNEGVAWECFRYGNTLALLPMNGHRSSAVVTVSTDAVPEWLSLSASDFAARVEKQSGGRLGSLQQVGERHHFPLVGVYADRFVAQRFALIGDAAVGMHPVTAHGWNLGLQGVDTLAREVGAARAGRRDIGGEPGLNAFERAHRRATWPTYAATNALVSLFTDERPPVKLLRRAVLDIAGHLPPCNALIRSLVLHQLTTDSSVAVTQGRASLVFQEGRDS
jgi:ubiquinone biosynthesis UbiH/UbiF/VisC/COQ6 family hydroxylase